MSELKSASFGAMIKAALGGDLIDGVQSNAQGERFALAVESPSGDRGGRYRAGAGARR